MKKFFDGSCVFNFYYSKTTFITEVEECDMFSYKKDKGTLFSTPEYWQIQIFKCQNQNSVYYIGTTSKKKFNFTQSALVWIHVFLLAENSDHVLFG